MKNIINFITISLLIISSYSVFGMDDTDLRSFCPVISEVKNWQPDGEPEIAEGEDLFLVINGGAEIYHEYGFKKAIFQTYIKSDGNAINLEIYEMESNAAAFGLSLKLGFEGWLESYYLNFWKGNYLVTLTSMQTDTSCIADLEKLANAVDNKIKCTSTLPPLLSFLPEENLQKNSIKYLKGNLALFNQDLFGPKNMFGLIEGIIGEYLDYLILIIKYQNNSEANKWYKSTAEHFKNSDEYKHFVEYNTHFEISDLKNNKLWIKSFTNFILIIQGNEILGTNKIFKNIEEIIIQ